MWVFPAVTSLYYYQDKLLTPQISSDVASITPGSYVHRKEFNLKKIETRQIERHDRETREDIARLSEMKRGIERRD